MISASSSSSSMSGALRKRSSQAALDAGRVVAERYEVVRLLGRGGMGAVYEARDRDSGTSVALKLMHAYLGQVRDAETRFRREARALHRLRSEHVARLLDFGRDQSGSLYLAMELVEGRDLSTELERQGAFDWPTAHAVIDQVCAALEAVHAGGLVHRDLKPRNVIVAHTGERLVAKVVDFGLSKALGRRDTPITREGVALGSIHYMAPEQAAGRVDVDARADVFSVGCVLYYLLMGQPPFSQRALARAGRHGGTLSFPSIAFRRNDVPAHVDEVLRVALSPAREHRFRNVEALRRALANEPSAVERTPLPVRLKRPHAPPGLWLALALAACGTAALVYALWGR